VIYISKDLLHMTVSGGIYIFVAFVNIRVKCLIRRRNFRVYVAWEFVLNRGIFSEIS